MDVQPEAVPVTVYVVVAVGAAVTLAPVVVERPAAGDQAYDAAPEAVRTVEPPVQIDAGDGVTVIVGPGVTVTTRELVIVLPQASVMKEYSVTDPDVGKVMVALAPVPADGAPVGLKLQL